MRYIVDRKDGEAHSITVTLGKYCNCCPGVRFGLRDNPSHCRFMRGSEYESPKGQYMPKMFDGSFHTHPQHGYYVRPIPEWCPLRNGSSIEVRGLIDAGELEKI